MTSWQDFEYLVDGYNLLLYQRRGKLRAGPGNLERARKSLLNWLSARTDRPERFSVVFDVPADNRRASMGSMSKREPEWSIVRGVRVAFAQGYSEADGLIADICNRQPQANRLCVVSNDRQLQEVARRSRAVWLDCAAFIALLEGKEDPAPSHRIAQPEDRAPDVSREEVQHWLGVFGGEPSDAAMETDTVGPPPAIPPPPGRPTYLEDPGLADFYRKMRESNDAQDPDEPPPKPKKR
jgi:predicted RNA-binding protein with PIN domain